MKARKAYSAAVEPVLALFLFGLWSFGYFVIGRLVGAENAYVLTTVADEALPFVPLFAYPYVALYPAFLLPFFVVRDREFFRICAWSYITVMVFCYLIFWNFPVAIQRPVVEPRDFTSWILYTVYRLDVPANCFPSMHAAMSLMAALTIYSVDRVRGVIVLFITLMIGASALLIKQHYIADILAGFGIAAICYHAYFRQRIHETITRDLMRVPHAIDHYIDEELERRLDAIIERKVEEKLRAWFKKNDVSPPGGGST
jgi:membrane-associated phospholipid phosphatase